MKFFANQFIILFLTIISIVIGQSVFSSLDIPGSVRGLALMNGGSAINSSILGNNPASLDINGKFWGIQYLTFPADITSHQFHFSTDTPKGSVSTEISIIDFGDLSDSATGESFSAKDFVIRVGYKSIWQDKLSWGITAGGIRSKIQLYEASGMFVDLGIRSRFFDNRLGIGISTENLGKIITSYSDLTESIDKQIRCALYYRPLHLPATISIDYLLSDALTPLFIAALEFKLSSETLIWISSNSEKNSLTWGSIFDTLTSGIAGGVRLPIRSISVDAGFQNLGSAGIVLGFGIGKKLN